MRFLTRVLVPLALFLDAAYVVRATPPQAPAAAVMAEPNEAVSSVRIWRAAPKEKGGWGTGTVIACEGDKSLILTNRHVVPDDKAPIYVFVGADPYKATFVSAAEGEVDLAVITVDVKLRHARLADKSPAAGTPVWQWGFGGREMVQGPSTKKGFVGPRTVRDVFGRDVSLNKDTTVTSVPVQSGDSGSGIFDKDGFIVAVCWGSQDPRELGWTQHCMSLDAVKTFLRGNVGFGFPKLVKSLSDK